MLHKPVMLKLIILTRWDNRSNFECLDEIFDLGDSLVFWCIATVSEYRMNKTASEKLFEVQQLKIKSSEEGFSVERVNSPTLQKKN